MSGVPVSIKSKPAESVRSSHTTEPVWVRVLLTVIALTIVAFVLVSLLIVIFTESFSSGWTGYVTALKDPDAVASIWVTLTTAAFVVPLNTVFGICAAWAITKFEFWGKSLLITLIDLPFSVSPVVSGLVWVLLFSRHGYFAPFIKAETLALALKLETFGDYLTLHHMTKIGASLSNSGQFLETHPLKIINTEIGIVLATTFVTFPFVARELIALMQSQGSEEEQAALVLGANGWQIFTRITLPNIKWGLITGILICNARAMGEFGAVNVVAGMYYTIPLQVDNFNSDNQLTSAFALASLLAFLALVTIVVKKIFEYVTERQSVQSE